MATIEKRIVELEARATSTGNRIKIFFCNEGEDEAAARLEAGIPPEHAGKVVCVQFVSSPNVLKEHIHADI